MNEQISKIQQVVASFAVAILIFIRPADKLCLLYEKNIIIRFCRFYRLS